MVTKDKLQRLAQAQFGVNYDSLSAFAQRDLIKMAIRMEEPTMQDYDGNLALRSAHERIAALERENLDLWEENEELRTELYDYEDSSSRSGRRTQARNRVSTEQGISDVPVTPPGIDPNIPND